jgi:alpha-L-arabinofuranosidase
MKTLLEVSMSAPESLSKKSTNIQSGKAELCIRAGKPDEQPLSQLLTGKFCEHLGSNIDNGMCAQILRNPTFADWPFPARGIKHPDGGFMLECDEEKIAGFLGGKHISRVWPEGQSQRLIESRLDGLAHWWIRQGQRDDCRVSPDVGPHGGRAQRVESKVAGGGLAQWLHLPLHRTRNYQWRVVGRSPDLSELKMQLLAQGEEKPIISWSIEGLSRSWNTFSGSFELPASADPDVVYRLAVVSPRVGQFVLERVLLYPADHVCGADPEVIDYLAQSHLPILRWPGGNFVSGYNWEDGVGPMDQRPTRPNMAWGQAEANLFGTDEFVEFCRAVGCRPMICVNAGDGTPGDAARWIEYCNGAVDTPEGARRAANGHPEPYQVHYWEIGNELTGRHQIGWTTPAGYADRYREFAEVMQAADPDIGLLACGAPMWWQDPWNAELFNKNADILGCISDHVLVGGSVSAATDPMEVYRDFMAVPGLYEKKYSRLRSEMTSAGISDPRLAITELQLFAFIKKGPEGKDAGPLTAENMVSPVTMAEAIFDVLIYHMSVRLSPFVEMITHSATVNHGGGLRKHHERVYANPCHYAQEAFAAFGGARVVPLELTCSEVQAPGVLDCTPAGTRIPELDVVAAQSKDGALLVSIVNCAGRGPVALSVNLKEFELAGTCDLTQLCSANPWDANSPEEPEKVSPSRKSLKLQDGKLDLEIPANSLLLLRFPPAPTV